MAPTFTDRNYLKSDQYAGPAKLNARIQLHQRFSTNQLSFFRWIYDQVGVEPGMNILEVGCGSGEFWKENAHRKLDHLHATLTDLSNGMVSNARQLMPVEVTAHFAAADAEHLPFGETRFDLILANHMLYHVPDIQQALREFRRVLVPGGKLCAATNGAGHMRELMDLRAELGFPPALMRAAERYGLDNAHEILGKTFTNVRIIPFENDLFVTETQPLIEYLHSMMGVWDLPIDKEDMLSHTITKKIQAAGGFKIHTEAGVVLAW